MCIFLQLVPGMLSRRTEWVRLANCCYIIHKLRVLFLSSTVFPTLRINTPCKFFFIYGFSTSNHQCCMTTNLVYILPYNADSCNDKRWLQVFCFRNMDFVFITNLWSLVKNKMKTFSLCTCHIAFYLQCQVKSASLS